MLEQQTELRNFRQQQPQMPMNQQQSPQQIPNHQNPQVQQFPPEMQQKIEECKQWQQSMMVQFAQKQQSMSQGQITQQEFDQYQLDSQQQSMKLMNEMQALQQKYGIMPSRMPQQQSRHHDHSNCNHDHGNGHGHNQGHGHEHGSNQRQGQTSHQHSQPHQQNIEMSGHHDHSQCNHKTNWNPFSHVPDNMRVFIWHNVIGGDYFLQLFMQLPMMGAGYQFYQMGKSYILMPIFQGNNFLSMMSESINIPIVKEVIGGFAFLYIIIHYMLFNYVIEPRLLLLQESELIFWSIRMILYGLISTYLLCILVDAGDLTTPKNKLEFEELINERPEMKLFKNSRLMCVLCQIPRIGRSQHCVYCKKCIARYETHSLMMNTNIGAYNYPFYILFLIFLTSYFFVILLSFTMNTKEKYPKQFSDLIAVLINLHQFITFGQSTLLCILRASYNITLSEISNYRRFTYFWKNERGEFFNPFDQGFFWNWVSIILPLFNKIFRKKANKQSLIDWGQVKILNVTDIPGHPMASLMSENIQKQVQRQQEAEGLNIRVQSYSQPDQKLQERGPVSNEPLLKEKNEEKQGLLDDTAQP